MADPVREARQELIRVGLLGETSAAGVVPDLVLRSWRRSISGGVESASPCQRYEAVETDSILFRAAEPILDRWQHQLTDTGTTLFLSDSSGSIVARRTSDTSVRRRLDRAHAAEGFDYSEDSVGTNGLGTSMVERRAVYIQGAQHYNDALAGLACAAAPVCTPSGSVIGSISLGGPIEVANPLMLSLTREIGQQIEERMRADARPQDIALAMSFMRFTNSKRPTVVMDHESLLANTPGLPYVNVTSHVMLWELLNSHDWSTGRPARLVLDEASVEVVARRVLDGPRAHYVVHFSDLAEPPGAAISARGLSREDIARVVAPARTRETGDALVVVDGPRGSGRATVARELLRDRGRTAALEVVTVSRASPTPWTVVADLLVGGRDVLVRRTEDVPESEGGHLRRLVDEQRAAWVGGRRTSTLLLTTCQDKASPAVRAIVDGVGLTARTEALSLTRERIPGLVKRILDRADPAGRHMLSPAALQSCMQWSWPGNVAELVDTLTALVHEVPASVIQRRHLPAHVQQAPPRRHLTLIESAERDAIIKALRATEGNKSEAAALLGIGRTTLYRRLRQLGLDDDEASL